MKVNIGAAATCAALLFGAASASADTIDSAQSTSNATQNTANSVIDGAQNSLRYSVGCTGTCFNLQPFVDDEQRFWSTLNSGTNTAVDDEQRFLTAEQAATNQAIADEQRFLAQVRSGGDQIVSDEQRFVAGLQQGGWTFVADEQRFLSGVGIAPDPEAVGGLAGIPGTSAMTVYSVADDGMADAPAIVAEETQLDASTGSDHTYAALMPDGTGVRIVVSDDDDDVVGVPTVSQVQGVPTLVIPAKFGPYRSHLFKINKKLSHRSAVRFARTVRDKGLLAGLGSIGAALKLAGPQAAIVQSLLTFYASTVVNRTLDAATDNPNSSICISFGVDVQRFGIPGPDPILPVPAPSPFYSAKAC